MRDAEQRRNGGKRVETVVETISGLRGPGESLAEVAHDVRNMVTALGLYCELLEEPGVLTPACRHYGQELRMVAVSSRRLVEKMMALNARLTPSSERGKKSTQHWEIAPAAPVENLAAELQANRNLLAALAGAAVTLTVEVQGGALPVSLTGEELTRVLVNLVKNAADAMPTGGRIHLELREAGSDLQLMVEDSGPGIAPEALESIFLSGYSTRLENDSWTESHRGLGLAITRSIVEASGGSITVSNRSEGGARFVLRLPVREG